MNEQDNIVVSGDEMRMKDSQALSLEKRHCMIAEAAYFRAECRRFQGGDPVADWLEAEAEIEAKLRKVLPLEEP